MSEYAIALDVGGTFIKSALLDSSGSVCAGTEESFPAYADAPKEEILCRLTDIIGNQANKIINRKSSISGIGLAFPGPFDYDNGICYNSGGDKYESLYGVNIRDELMKRITALAHFRSLSEGFRIVFENDAALFLLGEWLALEAGAIERCIGLTIGTGAGSAFMIDGKLVLSGNGVPDGGWLYLQPFGESIVDDYISRRGLLRLAAERDVPPGLDVREIAERARDGWGDAIEVFNAFGFAVGEMLLPYVRAFRADRLIIGGQIAKSYSLFERTLREALSPIHVVIAFAEDTSLSTYRGVHLLLQQKRDN